MLELAKNDSGNKPVSLSAAAEKGNLPQRYLEQLVIGLKHASLIQGVSGKVGGYRLTRPASEIRIGDIVEAAIGPINIVDCVGDPRSCLKADVCECRLVYTLINRRITEVLDEFTLADMLDKKWYRQISRQLERQPAVSAGRRNVRSTTTSGAAR
jgi:Rrf2 family protein